MANALPIRLNESQLAKFSAILGAGPVLSTENAEHYNEIWDHLLKCFIPRDFMELFLIRQVQQATWMIQRYNRHQTVAIDRRFRESLEFQLKRKQLQKARREALAIKIAEKSGRPVSDLQRLIDLDVTTLSALQEADEILARPPSELDHNRALEAGIKFHTQLDQLINSEHKRLESALKQLEWYRDGLGPYLRRISDEIIDVATLRTEELSNKMEVPKIEPPGRENFEAIMSLNKSMASTRDATQEGFVSSAESFTKRVRAPDQESE